MTKNRALPFFTAVILLAGLFLTACGSSATDSPSSGESGKAPTSDSAAYPEEAGTVSDLDSARTRNSITVNSSETVSVSPDIAQVVYAVRTEQKTAAECQTKNTEDVNQVIEVLKSLHVAETSIRTSDYSMYPMYNYSNGVQKLIGYEAVSTLTVSDLPIDGLGDILAQSVRTGINSIQSITYQSSRYDESYHEALKLAVASAREKAQALAEAAGCTLGNAVCITENSNYTEARYNGNSLTAGMVEDMQAAREDIIAPSIMPGKMDVEAGITVEYLLRPGM